jgi:DNA repair photolyase
MKIREVKCKAALGKCGFPGGGLAINPYVGCSHACAYCYARFIKRFTGHREEWGSFVDVRINIAEVLARQMPSPKWRGQRIYIGTVTDPYQPLEVKYQLTRQILKVLKDYANPVSILTKSALVWRDADLLKELKKADVNFTFASLNENWQKVTEPHSSSAKQRLETARKLSGQGIAVHAMIGPYWPHFTNAEVLFKEFQKAGVKGVFAESFNAVGGNWTGVERVLKQKYPELYPRMREIFFDPAEFAEFYQGEKEKLRELARKYRLPITIYFGQGHAAKFQ